MAQVEVFGIDGEAIAIPSRVSGGDHDAPTVTIIVCEAGQYIDGESDTLHFVPAPLPPVIERVEVASSVSVGTAGVSDVTPMTDAAAIASLERHFAGMRSDDPAEDDEPNWKRRIRERNGDFSGEAPDGWWR